MLADIDDPPRSRVRGMLIGLALALPLVAVFVGVMVPTLIAKILGGAQRFDERLRQQDAYMTAVCTRAMVLPRDEGLCECVLAVEFPSLDCQAPFEAWSIQRQQEYCGDPDHSKASLSFCACIDTIAQLQDEREADERADVAAAAYHRCQELPDRVELPSVAALGGGAESSE